MHPDRVASLATRDRQHRRHWRRRPYIPVRSHGTDSDLTLGWGDQYRVLDTETQPPATVLNGPVFGPIGRPGSPDGRFLARVHALEAVFAGCCRNRVALGCSPLFRDFRFACPRWPLYTPEGRPAPETLVRHSIVPLQRPSAQPVVTCGRLEALCSRHFSDTAPHVGHWVKIRYLPEFIGLMARLSPPYDTLSRAERGSPRAGGRKERRPCRHSRDRFAARDPSRWERRGGSDRQDWRDGAEPDRVPQGYQPRGGMPHGILAQAGALDHRYAGEAALVHNSRSRSIIALHPEIRGPA